MDARWIILIGAITVISMWVGYWMGVDATERRDK